MASFQDRVVGALRLQAATFEEIEHDQTALPQSAMVIFAVAVAGVIASFGRWFDAGAAVASIAFAFIGWAVSSAVVWIIGTRLMPGRNTEADYPQMLRVMGFAQAPGLLSVLGIIPFLGWLFRFIAWAWTLVALVIAVRQALDYDDTLKAVIVCVIAWIVMLLATIMVGVLGFGAAMAGSALS